MPGQHAFLSASHSNQWLNCPPSVRLEEQFPAGTSPFAEEGTFAHDFAEHSLLNYLHPNKALFAGYYNEAKKSKHYSQDLEDYVHEYTDLCIEKINNALAKDAGAAALVEERLDFSEWVPKGFGTGDMVIISDGILEIVDLKYGQGVKVEAEGNTQMQLYALGAINTYACLYDFEFVRMTICQPRNGGVSSQEMSVKELLAWGKRIKPIAQLAMKGEGDFKAGEHCRFCRAAVRCKALANYNLEIAKLEFAEPNLLSDADIADVVLRIDTLKRYADKVKDYAICEALSGKKWPGLKLVEGRSNRKYTDEEKIADVLTLAGFEEDQIYKRKELLAITELTKAITKKKFNELVSDYTYKPDGKPALVSEADKRPEFNPIENDFKNLDDKGEM